uniref:DUF6246 family protein n=1 Tax=Xenorhabdus beddingii TaxID=40578 RepID=UPI001FC9C59A
MTPIIDIGEMVIATDKTDYLLQPSFAAMTRIGTPQQIVAVYTLLNGAETQELMHRAALAYGTIPDWLITLMRKPAFGRNILSTSMMVIQACCEEDVEELIGDWRPGRRGVVY